MNWYRSAKYDSSSDRLTARAAINGQPLTVRIGYQSPNARLAATVGTIAKSCAAAGITVQDDASDSTGPQSLRDNQIDLGAIDPLDEDGTFAVHRSEICAH